MNLISVRDAEGTRNDRFVMEIKASMIDYTVREFDGKFVYSTCPKLSVFEKSASYQARAKTQPRLFTENWTFVRDGQNWLLREIKELIYSPGH